MAENFPSPLSDYFDYNTGTYGTPSAPQIRNSVAWDNLLAMLFTTTSITVEPPNDPGGLFTQDIAFENPNSDKWALLSGDVSYALGGMTMQTVGYSPPQPRLSPAPTNKLKGEVQLGLSMDSAQIPLDGSVTYTHDASALTITQLFNFFGGMVTQVGAQASIFPCPIAAVGPQIVGVVRTVAPGNDANITVNFGEAPDVAIELSVVATDPVEHGVLTLFSLTAAEGSLQLYIEYTYKGMALSTSLSYSNQTVTSYEMVECVPDRPTDPLPPIVVVIIRRLLRSIRVRSPDWTSIFKYLSDWFAAITTAVLVTMAAAAVTAAAEAQKGLSLATLAASLVLAFTSALASAATLMAVLKSSGQSDGNSPVAVARATHAAGDYSVTDISRGLVENWGYGIDDAVTLIGVLRQSEVETDPEGMALVLHITWRDITPPQVAIAITQGFNGVGVVTVAKGLIGAFPGFFGGGLTGAGLAAALQQAGFSLPDVARGLATVMNLTPSEFVSDLVEAFQGSSNPATIAPQVAVACANANYTAPETFDAMSSIQYLAANQDFILEAMRTAYPNVTYCLTPNGGRFGLFSGANYNFASHIPFTFEVVLQCTSTSLFGALVRKWDPQGNGFDITLGQDNGFGPQVKIFQFVSPAAKGYFAMLTPPILLDGHPHTIAFTGSDAEVGVYQVDVYVDGQNLGTGYNFIYAQNAVMPTFFYRMKNVNIFAARVWPTALSAAQLLQNVTTPPLPAETIGDWDFRSGSYLDTSPRGVEGWLEEGAKITCLGG